MFSLTLFILLCFIEIRRYSLIWPIRGCAAGQGMVFEISVPKQGIFDFQNEFCTQKQLLWSEFALLQLLINGFKTRRRGIVLCPNWGCCLKQGMYFMIFFFVLNRVRVSNSQRLTYTQILVQSPHPLPDFRIYVPSVHLESASVSMEKSRLL